MIFFLKSIHSLLEIYSILKNGTIFQELESSLSIVRFNNYQFLRKIFGQRPLVIEQFAILDKYVGNLKADKF